MYSNPWVRQLKTIMLGYNNTLIKHLYTTENRCICDKISSVVSQRSHPNTVIHTDLFPIFSVDDFWERKVYGWSLSDFEYEGYALRFPDAISIFVLIFQENQFIIYHIFKKRHRIGEKKHRKKLFKVLQITLPIGLVIAK